LDLAAHRIATRMDPAWYVKPEGAVAAKSKDGPVGAAG
jgi:hypothetical protein